MSEEVQGVVKWYDQIKGYGFIAVPGREKDIFFHAKQWNIAAANTIPITGEPLVFEIAEGPKGAYATGIVRQNGGANAASLGKTA